MHYKRWQRHGDPVAGATYADPAKLVNADVRAIRIRLASGETQASIAADYGVVPATISMIANRKNWAWLI